MDVSAEEVVDDRWIAQAFGVPSVPPNRRDHYPFSRDAALVYRLKLALVLLNAACALFRMDEPCLRISFVLHCWLICVTCEAVYKNYPWREPLNVWMWRLRWAIPFWSLGVLSTPFVALLVLAWSHLGTGCEMPHPLVAACVGWLCCMVSWPLVRERWIQEKRSQADYDQFSSIRPSVLTYPWPLGKLLAAFRSPSVFTLLAASLASWVVSLILPIWWSDLWVASVVSLVFAVLCCHRLPTDVERTKAVWIAEKTKYLRKIELDFIKTKGTLKNNPYNSFVFDKLSVHVPLLQREARILLSTSRTQSIDLEDAKNVLKVEYLEELTTAQEYLEFGEALDNFGPYTTECCVS